MRTLLLAIALVSGALTSLHGQAVTTIAPSRPVPVGKAPHLTSKLVKQSPDERVYAIVLLKGDELLSGLTDFCIAQHITDAHFTGIGAVSGGTLAWLSLPEKLYHAIPLTQQSEVLSLTGDVATFNGKPVVHMHAVLGHEDGSTQGGHVFELNVDPTLEIFLTANTATLNKRPDEPSGMKLIDPQH